MKKLRAVLDLFKETIFAWSEDRAPRLGAALAYYSVFSIAPLLLLVIAVVTALFHVKEDAIYEPIKTTVPGPVATAIVEMIHSAEASQSTTLATVLGVIILVFAATGVFGELQESLNTIWKVQPKPGRVLWTIIKERFLSFTMVVGTGFLLLVSLVISMALEAVNTWCKDTLPGGAPFWLVINWLVTLAFISLVFALIYKLVPDIKIAWGDVWYGAILTALLFNLGKFVLGLYLGWNATTSPYGAAGSLVVILLWVYYSSQILLFGAEFTRIYARRHGSHVAVADNAVPVTPAELAQQGIPRQQDIEAAARHPEEAASLNLATGKIESPEEAARSAN